MPFCTSCGKQNPDDARFCSQCGTRLAPPRRAGAPGESPERVDRDDHLRRRPARSRAPRRSAPLNDADAAAVDALPPGSALLVVQRGPSAGSRFLLDTDVVDRRAAPRQRDLPRRRDRLAPARGVPPRRRRLHASATSAASTAPTSTATGSTRSASRTATRSRSASTASSSSPATRAADAVSDARRPRPSGSRRADEHRGGARPAARGLPGRHHPQDPLPRGQGADQARADAVGLPQVLRTTTSSGCATSCAMQRDHYLPLQGDRRAPRRDRPRPRAAADRRRWSRRCRRWRWPPTGCPSAESFSRRDQRCGSRAASCSRSPRSPRSCSTSSSSSAWSRRAPGTGHYDTDALVIARTAARAGRLRLRAAPPAGVQDRRRPRGRPGRAGRRARIERGRDAARPGPRRGGRSREIAALSVRLHATLVKAGLRDLTGRPPARPVGPGVG